MIIPKESRGKRIAIACIAGCILIPATFGFGTKLYEFIRAVRGDHTVQFTLVPLANYFLATLGFTCLMIWGILHGQFRDLEAPKYDMLERERKLDAWQQAKD